VFDIDRNMLKKYLLKF